MICPQCKHEVPDWKYCWECGNKLFEPCPDGCGKWEPIGRPVCETALAAAEEKKRRYLERPNRWFNLLYLPGIIITGIAGGILLLLYSGAATLKGGWSVRDLVAIGSIALISIFVVGLIQKFYEKKREENFAEKFPADADIIRRGKKE